MKNWTINIIILLLIIIWIAPTFSYAVAGEKSLPEPGEIRGRLIDSETNEPIVDIWLHLFKFAGVSEDGAMMIELFILEGKFPRLETNDTGAFSFSGVPDGEYVIQTGSQFEPVGDYLSLAQGESRSVIIIKIENNRGVDLGDIRVERE